MKRASHLTAGYIHHILNPEIGEPPDEMLMSLSLRIRVQRATRCPRPSLLEGRYWARVIWRAIPMSLPSFIGKNILPRAIEEITLRSSVHQLLDERLSMSETWNIKNAC